MADEVEMFEQADSPFHIRAICSIVSAKSSRKTEEEKTKDLPDCVCLGRSHGIHCKAYETKRAHSNNRGRFEALEFMVFTNILIDERQSGRSGCFEATDFFVVDLERPWLLAPNKEDRETKRFFLEPKR